jgi:hypothetical protein
MKKLIINIHTIMAWDKNRFFEWKVKIINQKSEVSHINSPRCEQANIQSQ